MSTPLQPLTLLVVAIADWLQRDQQAAIVYLLEEEVDQALGCRSYERAEDRRGYRNGAETGRVTTSVGTRELRVLRARVRDEETGETTEFRSELLPRYARRTREIDEAILGTSSCPKTQTNSRPARRAVFSD